MLSQPPDASLLFQQLAPTLLTTHFITLVCKFSDNMRFAIGMIALFTMTTASVQAVTQADSCKTPEGTPNGSQYLYAVRTTIANEDPVLTQSLCDSVDKERILACPAGDVMWRYDDVGAICDVRSATMMRNGMN